MSLTTQDYEVLIEALSAWEGRHCMADSMLMMMKSGFCKTKEEAKESVATSQQEIEQKERERRPEKERSILLKAKLITLRDSLAADELLKASQT